MNKVLETGPKGKLRFNGSTYNSDTFPDTQHSRE